MPLLKGIVAALVAIGLAVAATVVLDRASRAPDAPPQAGGSGAPVGATPNTAVLFYVAEDGTALVTRTVQIPAEGDALTRARTVAERQLAPPALPLISAFPAGTRLRGIYLTAEGNAFVDLSGDVSAAHPGGSLDELFTVYALVNALVSNVQEIAAVQILVEGREVDTLAGHVDLRRPLGLGMQWVGGIGRAAGYQEAPAGQ